ncbi:hypothetical protein [Rathayibacter sp. VKM Ac-2760]|uniref:hypothetical protein n=1 Tax=Rathayibacter sp. VKM Ac-2760 TaxID=2609253 RepID=UPI001317388C|nr:hypothetical protein [Rathayibacter sp. VKM Ac-2760]QHC57823.1 hypothetical protein GSU72_03970 [Rathayibacter sp. VKM Ac-2760]
MGEQREGETILEWAEPLLGRIDWAMKRSVPAELGDTVGVTVTRSELQNCDVARVDATIVDGDRVERSAVFLEATWSESFVPVSRTETFQWGAKFLWVALWRMFTHNYRTMLWVPLTVPGWFGGAGRLVRVAVGAAAVVLEGVVLAVLGAVLTVFLILASPLLLVPAVKAALQPIVDTLVAFIGDVATFRRHPLRSAAMKKVVADRLKLAHLLLGERPDIEIIVIAHSQGTAITLASLYETEHERADWTTPIHVNTLGTAINLLGRSAYLGRRASGIFDPVKRWSALEHGFAWDNFWGIWDPVPSGPMGDSRKKRDARWRSIYSSSSSSLQMSAPGPREHPLQNTASPFTDHITYPKNILQAIDPLAARIDPRVAAMTAAQCPPTSTERWVSGIRRSRPVAMVAALVIATWFGAQVVVPSMAIAFVREEVARWTDPIRDTFLAVFGGILDIAGDPQHAVLVGIGWVLFLSAPLVWLHGLFASRNERALVWPDRAKESAGSDQSDGAAPASRGTLLAGRFRIVTPLVVYLLGVVVAVLLWQPPSAEHVVWVIVCLLAAVLIPFSVFAPTPGAVFTDTAPAQTSPGT